MASLIDHINFGQTHDGRAPTAWSFLLTSTTTKSFSPNSGFLMRSATSPHSKLLADDAGVGYACHQLLRADSGAEFTVIELSVFVA